jgi:hypothetical protein
VRTGAARLAGGGRFACTVRAGRSRGTGTWIVGSEVEVADGERVVAAGAGALLCAHTLHGTSNAITPAHSRRMNFPDAEFMAEAWQPGELPPYAPRALAKPRLAA